MVTCPNPSCARVFAIPLKTLNLQDSTGPYPACPFCLTRIVPETSKPQIQDESRPSKEKKDKNGKEKPQACHYHLGYLSERKDKEQIPEDCIVCRFLVDCMLQKMRTIPT
jgi:hypothetical protein